MIIPFYVYWLCTGLVCTGMCPNIDPYLIVADGSHGTHNCRSCKGRVMVRIRARAMAGVRVAAQFWCIDGEPVTLTSMACWSCFTDDYGFWELLRCRDKQMGTDADGHQNTFVRRERAGHGLT